jgi:hypothetical protein
MAQVKKEEINKYVEEHIGSFHKARIKSLTRLKLAKLLRRKNPYLFRAKNIVAPSALVKALLDAHLSSQEEGLLGGVLEGLAIFIAGKTRRGKKSTAPGLDLEFDYQKKRYLIAIKSGPNWGNSSQIRKMKDDFIRAKRVLGQSEDALPIEVINGCCYGRQKKGTENKGDYIKLCGQPFWELVSGDAEMFAKIVEPIGIKAAERNADFEKQYRKVLDAFTELFKVDFCDKRGNILWDKVARFTSAEKPPELEMTKRKQRPEAEKASRQLEAVGAQATDAESESIVKAAEKEKKPGD